MSYLSSLPSCWYPPGPAPCPASAETSATKATATSVTAEGGGGRRVSLTGKAHRRRRTDPASAPCCRLSQACLWGKRVLHLRANTRVSANASIKKTVEDVAASKGWSRVQPSGHEANLSQRLWYALILTLIMCQHKKAEHQPSCRAHLIRSAGTGFHCALHARVEALLRRLAREIDGLPHGCAQGPTNREGSQGWVRICCRVGCMCCGGVREERPKTGTSTHGGRQKSQNMWCVREGGSTHALGKEEEEERSYAPHELSNQAFRAASRHT